LCNRQFCSINIQRKMSKKKDKIRIEFNVHIQMLRDLPKSMIGTEIFIECHRGKKTKNFRCTDNRMVNQANVNFDTKYKWELGLIQNTKTNPPTFEPKKQLVFSIKQFPQGSKKAVTWGKATYELSTHANHGTIRTEILEITKEKKDKTDTSKTNLVMKLETKWLDKTAKSPEPQRPSKVDRDEEEEEPTSDRSDDRDSRTRRDTARGKDTPKDRDLKDRKDSMRPGHKIEQLSDLEDEDDLQDSEEEQPKSRRDKDKIKGRSREDSEPEEEEEYTPRNNNKSKDKEPGSSKLSREATKEAKETPKDKKDSRDTISKDSRRSRISTLDSDEDKSEEPKSDEEVKEVPTETPAEMEAELDDLRRDKQRLEKRVERLVKDLEEAKQKLIEEQQKNSSVQASTPATKSNSATPNEVDDLKRDKQRLERKAEKMTKEIAELKESLAKANEEAKNGKRDRVSTVGGRRTLELEMEDQSKQISELTSKLKVASQTCQDIFQATINYIERNSVDNNSSDPSALVFWLNYTTETFRIIYSDTKTFDKKAFMKSLDEPDLDIDDLDPVPKFLHQLIRTSFDIFATLVRNAFSLFEPYIESFIVDQKAPKKQEQALSNFTNHIQEALGAVKSCSARVQEAFLDQLFALIDAQLFNCLMKKTNLFRCNSGFQIKMLLSKIDSVCSKTLKQLNLNVAMSHDHLGFIKEAANLLVMDKSIMGDEETRKQIFTKLNILQISYIMKYFEPDDTAPDPIPEKVKRAIEAASAQAQRRNDSVKLELDPTDVKRVNLCFNT